MSCQTEKQALDAAQADLQDAGTNRDIANAKLADAEAAVDAAQQARDEAANAADQAQSNVVNAADAYSVASNAYVQCVVGGNEPLPPVPSPLRAR